MKLVSWDSCFGIRPLPDTVATQRLQLWADGQVKLERVTEAKQRRRKSFHISPEAAQKVLSSVGRYFESVGLLYRVTDCGMWHLTLKGDEGEPYQAECSLHEDLFLEDGTGLSALLRETLGLPDLFAFNGGIPDEEGY